MAEFIEEFLTKFGVETDESSFKTAMNAFEKLNEFADGVFKNMAATAASAIGEQIESLNNLFHTSQAAGIAADELDRYSQAAEMAGLESGKLTGILSSLNVKIGESARGWGAGAENFAMVGISARNAAGELKTAGEVLDEIQGKLKGKSRIQQQTFLEWMGFSIEDIEYFTDTLGNASEEYSKIMGSFGTDLNKAAEGAKNFQNTLSRFQFLGNQVVRSFTADLLPELSENLNKIYKNLVNNLPKIRDFLRPVAETLNKVLSAAGSMISRLIQWGGKLLDGLKFLNDSLGGIPGKIVLIYAGFRALSLLLTSSPFGAVLTGIALTVAAIADDIQTWKEGGDSLVDWGDALKTVSEVSKSVAENLGEAHDWLVKNSEVAKTASDYFKGLDLGEAFKKLSNDFKYLARNIKDIVSSVFEDLSREYPSLSGFFKLFTSDSFSAPPPTQGSVQNIQNSVQNANRNTQKTVNFSSNITVNGNVTPENEQEIERANRRNLERAMSQF